MLARRAAIAANLREAGDAGLQRVAQPVFLRHLPEQFVAGQRAECVRSRADDAHVALQHVEQLRQLVDAGHADDAADAGDAIVVARGRAVAVEVARLDVHAAELEDLERLVVSPQPSLREQHRAAALQPDRDRDEDQQRRQRHHRRAGQHQVHRALLHPRAERHRPARDDHRVAAVVACDVDRAERGLALQQDFGGDAIGLHQQRPLPPALLH